MNTRRKKIEAIAITAIAVLAIFAVIGTASAAVSNIVMTDGNDEKFFYGEEITLTWTSTNPKSVLWINSTGTGWGVGSDDNTTMNDNKSGDPLGAKVVLGSVSGSVFIYTYTFANYTVNESAQAWIVLINDTIGATVPGPANQSFIMSSYNVSLQTGRSAAEGNSTLAGDTIEISVNTSGMLAKTERDGLGITIELPEGGNTVSGANNVAGTGNYTFNITAVETGVGVLKNITLNYGGFSWNSTQLRDYSGWASAANTQFNVSKVNLKAYDINGTKDVTQNITSVNITALLGGSKVSANLSYPINITLTCDLSNLQFNNTGTPASFLNLTIPAGSNESSQAYGNYTIPANATLTSGVTSRTTGTITATVNTSGMTWTDTFVIHPTSEYNKIEAPADGTSYQIGRLVNITGWNATGVAPTLNITEVRTGAAVLNSTVVTLNPIDNSFEYTWNTNWTWNTRQAQTWGDTYNKTGTYKLELGNGTSAYIDSITIALNENIAVETNATSMPVNGSLWINGTSDRWNSNGTILNCNISTGADRTGIIINGTLRNTTRTFNATPGLATYSILWDSSDNITQIVQSAAPVSSDTFNKLYYITVNDSATKNTTATFRITDNISIEPATGVGGRNFTARGTSARTNGTNISVQIQSSTGIHYRTNYTTVSGNKWNITMNASTDTGIPLTIIGSPYVLIVNDSIVKDTATLTIGEGTITLEVAPAETTMDGVVWLNGTTDLTNGTVIWFNITNATGVPINSTGVNIPKKIVKVDQTFNHSWQVNTSLISGNFTAPEEQCTVKAYNDTIYTTGTLTVTEYLSITTPDFEIAPGREFKIEGTLDRIDGTGVQIVTADVGGLPTNTTSATVYGEKFNQTLYAKHTLGDLPIGEYTITVKDGINASASINMTVVAARVTLDSPVDGATYEVNDTIPIDGTSNLGNNTNITVRISRTSGPTGWTPFSTMLYGITNFTGYWNTTWNTSADTTFQALSTKSGDYQVSAWNGSTYSITHTITLTPAVVPGAPSITAISPTDTTPTNVEGTSRMFSVTVNQTVDVSWYLNESLLYTNTSVTEASYTNASAVVGVWNVSAIAENDNGTAMRTWMWTVTEEVPVVSHVVINEFIASRWEYPATDLIELYNPTDADVNLTDWTLVAHDPETTTAIALLDGETIDAYGYLVYECVAEGPFTISQSGDILILKNGSDEVDRVAWGDHDDGDVTDNAPEPGLENSTGRDPNGVDTDIDIDDFKVFTTPTIGADNTPGAVGTTGDININEIMYDPSSAIGPDADMEWVELYNNDTAAIDMSGWTLDGSAISSATTMQPGDYLIIAKDKTAFESYYTTVTCTIIDMPSLSLTNTGDTIVLSNSTAVEMDSVTYTSALGADGNGKTLELNATGGWEESTVDGGTPCAENSVIAAPWDPWDYDEDGDEAISKDEVLTAINDYFADKITKDQVLQVINLYFAT